MGKAKARSRNASSACSSAPTRSFRGKAAMYLPVLHRYCSPKVVEEFNALPPTAQQTMLDGVREAVRQMHLRLAMSAMDEHGVGSGRHTSEDQIMRFLHAQQAAAGNTQTCPLAAALRAELTHGMPVPEDQVQAMRTKLATWGEPKPSDVTYEYHKRALLERQFAKLAAGNQPQYGLATTSASIRKDVATSKIQWSELRPVTIKDLTLFSAVRGAVLTGTLVSAPLALTAVISIFKDDNGDMTSVCLYNQIPGGEIAQTNEAFVNRKFAAGTRIAIAEPYYKIGLDGTRAVRVDSSSEVKLGADAQLGQAGTALKRQPYPGHDSLRDIAQESEDLLTQKQPEQAIATCLSALRSSHVAALTTPLVLLANRAQAALCCNDGTAALSDAAAVLVLDPTHSKACFRYKAALRLVLSKEGIDPSAIEMRCTAVHSPDNVQPSADTTPGLEEVEAVLRTALSDVELMKVQDSQNVDPATQDRSAAQLKERGNERFRAGDHLAAAQAYTAALSRHENTEDLARVLCALADACLSVNSLHSALAAAAAASCLTRGTAQPLYVRATVLLVYALALLGRPGLAHELLNARAAQYRLAGEKGFQTRKVSGVRESVSNMEAFDQRGNVIATGEARDVAMDWLGPVKLAAIPGKGRGLVATADLPAGATVLINRPLVSSKVGKRDTFSFELNGDVAAVHASQQVLRGKAVELTAQDTLASRIVARLDDNSDGRHRRTLPLVPLDDLQQTLSARVLPLLPQTREYFPADEHEALSVPFVDRTCTLNAFTLSPKDGRTLYGVSERDTGSGLFPLASMINHDDDPNCIYSVGAKCDLHRKGEGAGVLVVGTMRRVQAGDELTIMYHGDPATVKRHWGI